MDGNMTLEFPQQSRLIVIDLRRIYEEVISAYTAAVKTEDEKDLKSIFGRVIQECVDCKYELESFLPENGPLEEGKHYRDWKGVDIVAAEKKTALIFCANDVLAVMNVCFSALTSPEIDAHLRDLLAQQQARFSKLYFHIEQFHDAL